MAAHPLPEACIKVGSGEERSVACGGLWAPRLKLERDPCQVARLSGRTASCKARSSTCWTWTECSLHLESPCCSYLVLAACMNNGYGPRTGPLEQASRRRELWELWELSINIEPVPILAGIAPSSRHEHASHKPNSTPERGSVLACRALDRLEKARRRRCPVGGQEDPSTTRRKVSVL